MTDCASALGDKSVEWQKYNIEIIFIHIRLASFHKC